MSSVVSVDAQPPEGAPDPEHTQHDEAVQERKQPGFARRVLVPLLIMLLGLAVLLYPVFSTQWNNWLQLRAVDDYAAEVVTSEEQDPETVAKALASAREFNESHRDGPILDPWLARIADDNVDYQAYLDELSDYPAMSQVAIPAIDSNLPVYHGSDEDTLQKGVGHLFGSALPIGGEGNHTVLTGHTGLTNATLWDNLIDVEKGDAVYLNTYGHKMKYEVHDTEVVLPDQTDSLKARDGEDLLTLITCTPYGVNTHRLLVHAHRVPMDAAEEDVFNDSGHLMQWWMWLVLALAAVALAGIIWWLRKQNQANQADQADSATAEQAKDTAIDGAKEPGADDTGSSVNNIEGGASDEEN